MSEPLELAESGSFCWNEACALYGVVGKGNLRKYGKTRQGVQRFQCKTCAKVFVATRGTPFHGVHHPEKMLQALAMLCERPSVRGVARVLEVKPSTVLAWLLKAAAHVLLIEQLLQRHHRITRAQLDALWAFVRHKGEKGGVRKRKTAAASGSTG